MRARSTRWSVAVVAALAAALLGAPGAPASPPLEAGAGRADITPPTGYYLMGWVRSDAQAAGAFTRLFARTLVLRQGRAKVALAAVDLAFVPGGLTADVAERLRRRGFDEDNIVISASHTHSAPAGYSNYPGFNFVAPTSTTPTEFELAPPAEVQLYTFLVRQIARSIARADRDRGPALAGWGQTKLRGVTENRSVEAHLAGDGVIREFGAGAAAEDPNGAVHTIDPDVDVLRVDKLAGGRRVPIGIFSTFANHGTVVKPTFPYYNGDHHAAAARVAEDAIRRIGDVPRSQEVVNAYGNADQGDMTAGLRFTGPAGAEAVGRREADAFVKAWRRAGRRMSGRLHLRTRWTIECFCGRQTAAGPVDDNAVVGLPFLTGSEENRGPLFDVTGIPFEGDRLPFGAGPQGVKIQAVPDPGGTFPLATPLTTIRVADRAILTVPGEMTAGMGRRLRQNAADAVRRSAIERIVISGLANDFLHYFTSPEEYDRQHFEGGATLFGRASAVFIEERLIELLKLLVAGRPAPEPDFYDARNGVVDDGVPFGTGARSATTLAQPAATERLDRASFRWRGGERGTDRPLERAFVRIQRRGGDGWRTVDSDLGLRIHWTVDDEGNYEALWEPGPRAPLGRHRFLVTANHYRLASDAFELRPATDLRARVVATRAGERRIELLYPAPVENLDLTWRPRRAPAASTTPGGAASDRYGNMSANRLGG